MNKIVIMLAVAVALLAFSAFVKADGFGEYAGYLIYNISINSSHTEAWTLINQYNTSIKFVITPPNLTINASNVTPVITFSVLNGTIPPNSNYQINVTAFIPYGAPANTVWTGYATAYASNANTSGSVKIQIGTSKFIKIISEPYIPPKPKKLPKTQQVNSTSNNTIGPNQVPSNSSNNYLIYAVIVLAMALVAAVAYILGMKSPKPLPKENSKRKSKRN